MADMTIRERYKSLHRARRVFKRDMDRMVGLVLSDPHIPIEEKLRAAERIVNPLLIYDPLLPRVV